MTSEIQFWIGKELFQIKDNHLVRTSCSNTIIKVIPSQRYNILSMNVSYNKGSFNDENLVQHQALNMS